MLSSSIAQIIRLARVPLILAGMLAALALAIPVQSAEAHASAHVRPSPKTALGAKAKRSTKPVRQNQSADRRVQAAHAGNVPYHEAVPFSCYYENGSGRIDSRPARLMRSWSTRYEVVYWSSDLFKWNGSSWVLVDGSKPYLSRVTNDPYGWAGPNWMSPNGLVTMFFPYKGLTSGYYAVKEYFKWSNGVVHTQWSTYNNSTSCRI